MRPLPETQDDSRYSQVSSTAVVAVLLGLASPLAFIGPLFYLIPAATIGAAFLAQSKIRRSGGALTGQTLARLAMALALGCMAATLVRASVRDALIERQAVAAAQRWIGLLADGRLKEASELLTTDGAGMLIPPPAMGREPLPVEEAKELLITNLRTQVLTQALAGQTDPGVFESVASPVYDGPKTIVLVRLAVEDAAEGGHRHVQVQTVRMPFYETQGEPWRIDRWETGEAHSAH